MILLNANTRQQIIDAAAAMVARQVFEEPAADIMQAVERKLIQTPLPGAKWVGYGGIYTGIMRDEGHYWHVILADDPMSIFSGAWGSEGTEIPGANSFADGLSNTQAMMTAGHDHPILKQLIKFNRTGEDGHTDFYLPAQKENSLIYIGAPSNVEECFHWSSTQYSAGDAWEQDFEYGTQYIGGKDGVRAARAVRRELII